MCEKISKKWDNAELNAIKDWFDSGKSFQQIDEMNNFPSGTLYTLVNAIPDYKGRRSSIKKWLGKMLPNMSKIVLQIPEQPKPKARKTAKRMKKKTSLHKDVTDCDKVERQLLRELDEARKKIACLEARQAKDSLMRDFLEGQLKEYRKLVKPSDSKKSNTK